MNTSLKTGFIYLFLFVIIVIGVLYLFFAGQGFELTGTSPGQGSSNNDLDLVIEFAYSQGLEPGQNVEYDSSPAIDADTRIDKSSFYIIPKHSLLEDTEYTVSVNNLVSEDGEQSEQQTLTFSTKLDDSPRARLIRSLPYYGDGYNITYTSNSDVFVVQLTDRPLDEKEEAALDYLQNQGIDVDTDNIKFETIRYLEGSGSPAG